jgi:hypothetical protein
MPKNAHNGDTFTWIISHIFTAGVLSFSMDLLKAFLLGIVGAFGGLLAKWFYFRFIKTKKNENGRD